MPTAYKNILFLIPSGLIALLIGLSATADSQPPRGFWLLESVNEETPYGGLKLNTPNKFTLLIYDNHCKLYTVNGSIKQKSDNSWELKNHVDYSNTFILKRRGDKLELVDTEDEQLLFTLTTADELKQGIRAYCKK